MKYYEKYEFLKLYSEFSIKNVQNQFFGILKGPFFGIL